MNEPASGSFTDSLQMANELVRAAKAFADRHVALMMEQECLGPERPFKKDTLLAMSEQGMLIRHIEQFVSGHFKKIEFQDPTTKRTHTMNTNIVTESTAASRLEDLSLETNTAKELREIILVLRAANLPDDKVCAFVDRFANGRKMYEV